MKRYLISLVVFIIGVVFLTLIMDGSLYYLFDIDSILAS